MGRRIGEWKVGSDRNEPAPQVIVPFRGGPRVAQHVSKTVIQAILITPGGPLTQSRDPTLPAKEHIYSDIAILSVYEGGAELPLLAVPFSNHAREGDGREMGCSFRQESRVMPDERMLRGVARVRSSGL